MLVRQYMLHFLKGDQSAMFQIMHETQRFDEFLYARRDTSVISPKLITLQFVLDFCVNHCNLGQFLATGRGRAPGKGVIIVFGVFSHYSMQ